MKSKKQQKITIVLFGAYFLLLIWALLFKFSFSIDELYMVRVANFIPYAGSFTQDGKLCVSEILGNIIAFMPFGIYMCMLNKNFSFLQKVLPIFLTSFTVETLQFILSIGCTDITDIINNTLGGIIGICSFYIFSKFWKNKTTKIINTLASLSTVCMVYILIFVVL